MHFLDWLSGIRTSRPALRKHRTARTRTPYVHVRGLEPRRLLSAQPLVPEHDADDHAGDCAPALGCLIPPPDPTLMRGQAAAVAEPGPFPDAETFTLHSRPSATKVIYLDFDGHITTNTSWNLAYNRATITTPAFDFEGGTGTFTSNELDRIQKIWARVAEAFSPFDVDVTTEEPALNDLRNTGGTDDRWGIRVAIGGTDSGVLGISAGGVAYLTSFNWDTDTPCFAFSDTLFDDEKFTADVIVHEVGHTLGLGHDGRTSPAETYYAGHGSGPTGWAPIMGVGYYQELVQWSQGEYPAANNTQDDLAIITTQNGFGYRADDHGNSAGSASPLMVDINGVVDDSGVIETRSDEDWFRFNTAGSVSLQIRPAVRFRGQPLNQSPMLDILAEIYDSNGTLVASSNPVDALDATFDLVLSVGTYYLKIDGVGKAANGSDFGYTDYSSLGQYSIAGTMQLQPNEPPVVDDQFLAIAENSPNGTVVGTVVASDPNAGQLLTYAITGGNSGNTFAINPTTGQITVNDPALLDFEAGTTFFLTVQVTDDGTPAFSDSATVTIFVSNVNETPVVMPEAFTVVENPPAGTVLGNITATDPDLGQTHTWAITAGNTGNAFAIDPSSGQITVANPGAILFAVNPVFLLTVEATDNGVPAQAGTATVTVNVIDRNLPPVIADQEFLLSENSPAGAAVGVVAASDPDAGQSIAYAITAGNTNNAFAIDAATGALTVANPTAIDFETNPVFTLTVRVTDNVIPAASSSAQITVRLVNTNDAPSVQSAAFTVIEFSQNGTTVGAVTVTDQDAGQTLTYAITGGNTGNAFAIHATTGVITIANTTAIDFPATPLFALTVTATDNGNPAASGSVSGWTLSRIQAG